MSTRSCCSTLSEDDDDDADEDEEGEDWDELEKKAESDDRKSVSGRVLPPP